MPDSCLLSFHSTSKIHCMLLLTSRWLRDPDRFITGFKLQLVISICLFCRTENSEHYDDVVEDAIRSLQEMKTVSRNNLQLGEDLFHKVAEIETELCAQVTGRCNFFILMLLVRTLYTTYFPTRTLLQQGGHSTGKTIWLLFPDRENTGNFLYFDLDYWYKNVSFLNFKISYPSLLPLAMCTISPVHSLSHYIDA